MQPGDTIIIYAAVDSFALSFSMFYAILLQLA